MEHQDAHEGAVDLSPWPFVGLYLGAVLIDQHLPGASTGAQLLAFLRDAEAFRGVPVYLLSGDDRCGREALGGIAVERCLRKPTTWDDTLALTKRLWHEMIAQR